MAFLVYTDRIRAYKGGQTPVTDCELESWAAKIDEMQEESGVLNSVAANLSKRLSAIDSELASKQREVTNLSKALSLATHGKPFAMTQHEADEIRGLVRNSGGQA